MLLIYIALNFPLFIPSKDEILVKKRHQLLCMRRRQDDISELYLLFSVWMSTWGLTPSPVHVSLPPTPLRVDVTNGKPLCKRENILDSSSTVSLSGLRLFSVVKYQGLTRPLEYQTISHMLLHIGLLGHLLSRSTLH